MKRYMALVVMMAFMSACALAQDSDIAQQEQASAVSEANSADSMVNSGKDIVEDETVVVTDKEGNVVAAAEETVVAPIPAPSDTKKPFNIYTEKYDLKNHYIPSGWMGDYGDIQIDDGCTVTPHEGKTCFKVKYTAKGSQGAGWMGIYWQNPANNWGTQMGGYDLSGYSKLVFYARGEKGGEVISEFKVGGINGNFADSDSTSIGPVTLTKDWKKYEIDLKGMDLSYISGGFMLSASSTDNPEGFTIYLDDMKYEK